VPVPPRLALARRTTPENGEAVAAAVAGRVGYPCFVKPASGGSSIGMSLVERADDLMAALQLAERYDDHLLIEARIPGVEVTCAVMDLLDAGGSVNTVAFPPTEIAPKAGAYFDYECKYTPGKTEELTPARLEPEVANEVRATALRVHSILGCEGFSRVDMLVDDGKVYVIELNAVPGMTPTSLFPQGAEAYGLSLAEVLDQFIRYAWWRK
jgi:D-alanine-D-alanine ligase